MKDETGSIIPRGYDLCMTRASIGSTKNVEVSPLDAWTSEESRHSPSKKPEERPIHREKRVSSRAKTRPDLLVQTLRKQRKLRSFRLGVNHGENQIARNAEKLHGTRQVQLKDLLTTVCGEVHSHTEN